MKRWGTDRRTDTMGNKLVDFKVTMRQEDFDLMDAIATKADVPLSLAFRQAVWAYLKDRA